MGQESFHKSEAQNFLYKSIAGEFSAAFSSGDLEPLEQRLLLTAPPVAIDDNNIQTQEDVAVVIDVLANDLTGGPTTTLSLLSVSDGRYGTVTIQDNKAVYWPIADFHGTDSFTYIAWDGVNQSNAATVSITVTSVEDVPTAGADAYTLPAGSRLVVDSAAQGVLASDYDGDGDPLTAHLVTGSGPAHGTLAFNADGTFDYTPQAGFIGTDSFEYVANDTKADSNIATVTLTVRAAGENAAPTPQNFSFDVVYGQTIQFGYVGGLVQTNSDPDGDVMTASLFGNAPSTLQVAVWPDGSFSATPVNLQESDFAADDTASVSFYYELSDGLASDIGAVTLKVHRESPGAADHSYSATHDGPLTVDAEHGLLSGALAGQPAQLGVQNVSTCANGGQITAFDAQTGAFTYVPAAGFVGQDSFTYSISNGVKTVTATVTIQVTNQAPYATPDSYTIDPTQPGQFVISDPAEGLLANDGDADGDALTVADFLPPASGTALTVNPDGTFTYTLPAARPAYDSFLYRVTDGISLSDWMSVTIKNPLLVPQALNDSYTVAHDRPFAVVRSSLGLLANDQLVGGQPSVVICTWPSHGFLRLINPAKGTFTYTPQAGYFGTDQFSYLVNDGRAMSNAAPVTITVTDAAPTAADLNLSANEDTAIIGPVRALLAGATDDDGDTLTTSLAAPAAHGTVTVAANGSYQYTPAANFNGMDGFAVLVSDGLLATQMNVTIAVIAVNDPPAITEPAYSVHAGKPLTVSAPGVLATASDVDGDLLTASLITPPVHGTLSLSSDGSFTYQPDASACNVQDSFVFGVFDGTATTVSTATVQITNTAPTAPYLNYYLSPGEQLTVPAVQGLTALSSDADGDVLSLVDFSTPVAQAYGGFIMNEGNGSFIYDPGAYNGFDAMTYTVTDGYATSQGTLAITVMNQPLMTTPETFRTLHDQTLTTTAQDGVLYNDWSANASAVLSVQLVQGPSEGTLNLAGDGSFTYVPPAGKSSTYSFTYRITDNFGHVSDPATDTIVVYDQAPVAQADGYSVVHDRALNITSTQGVLVNDYDLDKQDQGRLTVQLVQQAQHGHVTLNSGGSFTYQPNVHFTGADSFTYQALDGVQGISSQPTTVTFNVTNYAPTAADHQFNLLHDRTYSGSLIAGSYDLNLDSVAYRLVGAAAHGAASVSGNGSFTYTPAAGYVGSDSFTYVVNDGVADSPTATVKLNVTDNAPWAAPDTFRALHNTTVTGNLLANDADADGDALSMQVFYTPPSDFSFTWSPNGTFSLVPAPGSTFVGTVTFSYAAFDGAQWSLPVPVTVELTNSPPQCTPDHYQTRHDTPILLNVLYNDWDPDSEKMHLVAWSDPSEGTLALQGTQLLYTPPAAFAGEANFSYYVSDGVSTAGPTSVFIEVTNIPPHAVDDYFRTQAGQITTGNVLQNDVNDDGDSQTASLLYTTMYGALTFSGGSFSYTPQPGFTGLDSFSYSLSDGVETATATATIAVLPAVVQAIDDSFDVPAPAPFAGNVLSNDIYGAAASDTTCALTSQGGHGQVDLHTDGTFTYTPAAGFLGTDSFNYDLRMGDVTSQATVTLNVYAPLPQAQGVSAQVNEDASVIIDLSSQLAEGQFIAPESLSVPQHGQTVLISPTQIGYTPDADYSGDDSFKYAVSDAFGQRSTRAAVTITVLPQAHPTQAVEDSAVVLEDQFVTIDLLANDVDPDGAPSGAVTISTQPRHGTVSLAGGLATYHPEADYCGSDSFSYTITDGDLPASTAGVSITVCPVNDLPQAPSPELPVFHVSENSTAEIRPSQGFFNDVENGTQPRYLEIISQPSHGTAITDQTTSTSSITYSPQQGYHGSDSFTYRAYDNDWQFYQGTVTVCVDQAPYPPVVLNKILEVSWDDLSHYNEKALEDSCLLDGASDPNGGSLTVSSVRATMRLEGWFHDLLRAADAALDC